MDMVTIEKAVEAHNASIDRLDQRKTCQTCLWDGKANNPCEKCYDRLLFFHVNPTQWEAKQDGPLRGL